MPPSSLTTEELKSILDVQSKATEQMVIVATKLQIILENQERLLSQQTTSYDTLKNAVPGEIVKSVTGFVQQRNAECARYHVELCARLERVERGLWWMQLIFGAITLIVAIAAVVVQVIHGTITGQAPH